MSDPQALHAEIMAFDEADVILSPMPFLAAVKATLELHKPVPCSWLGCKGNGGHQLCAACGMAHNYPCQTVKVIASALGVVADG